MTADPRIPLQQIPPSSKDGLPPSDGAGSVSTAAIPSTGAAPRAVPRSAIWLRRTAVLLFISLCAVMGILLVILPWSLQWTDNRLLWGHPEWKAFLGNGFVRGLCSGLGIIDIWIGFREAAHYHEGPSPAEKKS